MEDSTGCAPQCSEGHTFPVHPRLDSNRAVLVQRCPLGAAPEIAWSAAWDLAEEQEASGGSPVKTVWRITVRQLPCLGWLLQSGEVTAVATEGTLRPRAQRLCRDGMTPGTSMPFKHQLPNMTIRNHVEIGGGGAESWRPRSNPQESKEMRSERIPSKEPRKHESREAALWTGPGQASPQRGLRG